MGSNGTGLLLIDASYLLLFKIFALKKRFTCSFVSDEDGLNNTTITPCIPYDAFCMELATTMDKLKNRHFQGLTSVQVIFARDCPRKNIWRNTIFDGYKGKRQNTAGVDLGIDMNVIFENIIPRHGLILSYDHLEADDVIFQVLNNLNLGVYSKVVVLSDDNDMLQLYSHFGTSLHIFNLFGNNLYDRLLKLGCSPEVFIKYKAIIGDISDNIPGIKRGVGCKTALKIVSTPGMLDSLLAADTAMKERYDLNIRLMDLSLAYGTDGFREYLEGKVSDANLATGCTVAN